MPANPSTSIYTRQEAIDWLYSRINYERSEPIPYSEQGMKLDRMRKLLDLLDNPQQQLKIIHIAGTKGKGSVGAMIAKGLMSAGHRVGVYSSPHLERIEERYQIDAEPIPAEQFIELVKTVQPVADVMDNQGEGPTFFDLATALAFLHFARARVDAAVIEVGLGGRLDSTNVVDPVACVITSISFDHMKQLGNTLAEIASEKGGIIKRGVPVVSGVGDGEAQAVLEQIALERDAPIVSRGHEFACLPGPKDGWDFSRQKSHNEERISGLKCAVPGQAHAENMATALALMGLLADMGWDLPIESRRRGVQHAVLPARMERIVGQPTVILDVAHNAASAQALGQAIHELCPGITKDSRNLVLAISEEKDTHGIITALSDHFSRVFVTRYLENPRAIPPPDLAEMVRAIAPELEVTEYEQPVEAFQAAVNGAEPSGAVVVTGSFFLAGELRRLVVQTSPK